MLRRCRRHISPSYPYLPIASSLSPQVPRSHLEDAPQTPPSTSISTLHHPQTLSILEPSTDSEHVRTGSMVLNRRPWLLVGLGNPGVKFIGTRHNVGFELIDAFAKSHNISMDSVHCRAIFGKGIVSATPVFLAKPQTFMNLSGESVGPLAAYYQLPLNQVLVIHDDMDLPCGVLRLHPNGNHGRHNGLKSVIHHFRGNLEFPRLRIGIGRPPGQMDPKAFLLQKFNVRARERIDAALQEGVDALEQVLSQGFTEAARCFNKEQKYKHGRLQTMPV